MPTLHRYDYLMAFGTMFALLDAFNIGANDACFLAAICEFLGGVLVGACLLAFARAITAWLMIATKNVVSFDILLIIVFNSQDLQSWTVSTTYSIISALIGVGVATGGAEYVNWDWNVGKGVTTIFTGFFIAPGIAAVFGATVYLLTKYIVLVRKNSVRVALMVSPVYFFTVARFYKGSSELKLDKLPKNTITADITAALVPITPFIRRLLLPVQLRTLRLPSPMRRTSRSRALSQKQPEVVLPSPLAKEVESVYSGFTPLKENLSWFAPVNLWIILRYRLIETPLHGTSVDVHTLQTGAEGSKEAARVAEIHAHATQYDNGTSIPYVMTACTASFAHGSNDLANAIGPWATIYYVWSTGLLAGKETPTPVWLIVVGALALVIGLATYGYNIMKALDNKLTLHSPSRGFSMELGSATTVILASQCTPLVYFAVSRCFIDGIPVSTTMCINLTLSATL
ncbi:sodium:inorganic phosphate symporter [Mycena vulgaris]|nr:sodium:inorganic phosphate symporter [Mycena vulgaris]